MATMAKNYPDVAIPQGEYLAEEIKERSVSQKELAKRMGWPPMPSMKPSTVRRPLPLKPPCNLKTGCQRLPLDSG